MVFRDDLQGFADLNALLAYARSRHWEVLQMGDCPLHLALLTRGNSQGKPAVRLWATQQGGPALQSLLFTYARPLLRTGMEPRVSWDQARTAGLRYVEVIARKAQAEITFHAVLISEIGLPAMDAASKDAAKMTIKFTPEYTRSKK
jgi:hypothetical protein